MANGYKLVPLEEAAPGMQLSDDYIDRRGHVLLPKGSILTEKLLSSLRRYEMELIPIAIEEETPEAQAMSSEYHKERLDILFRKQNYNQPLDNVNDVLQQIVFDYRLMEES
ncbi:MAG: hypothetical protein VB032_00390 [Burkholderiaceae bacterium]|nr:hypothetical protein [Burkholderiaceae bacterium]